MATNPPSGWLLQENCLRCAVAGGHVTLRVQGVGVPPSSCNLPGVDWQLREWTPYNVVSSVPIRAIRGLGSASPTSGTDGTVWSFQIRNRVGRVVFTVDTDAGSTAPLRVEVLSAKFPTPELHLSFLNGLIADLARQTRYAEFVPSAPTAFGVETDPRGPSLLSDLNTLLHWRDRLHEAVDGVVGDPHRTLTEIYERTRLVDLRYAAPQLLPQLVTSSAKRQRVPLEWPLAKKTRGVAPEWVVVPTAEETLDVPENRFVAMALRAASDALERLRVTPWVWNALTETSQDALTSFATRLDYVRMATFLGDLTPAPVPDASQVLARRPAYRAIWSFWQQLTSGRRSLLAEADEAIANRDIARLYELWAFFALCGCLSEALGPVQRWQDISDERFGVRHGAIASFANAWSLIYNQQYSSPKAYGISVRPDYLLQHGKERCVAFDAKFRFVLPRPDEEWYVDDDGDPAMNAVSADIMKMHAYRDALGIRSAVVVYPGNRDRMFTVEPKRGARLDEFTINDLIQGAFQGVGAIHLRPQA